LDGDERTYALKTNEVAICKSYFDPVFQMAINLHRSV
jgi:hypothetical protein